jgi:AraC-like DNA-binding protein
MIANPAPPPLRVLLPSSFPAHIGRVLQKLNFDVLLTRETDLLELLRLSGKERRLLFIERELLTESDLRHQISHGIVALSASARTAAGFKRAALPYVRSTAESQLIQHITYLNGVGGAEVFHLIYEKKREHERIWFPKGTTERFLHSSTQGTRELRGRGILLAGVTTTQAGYIVERRPALFHLLGIVLEGRLEFCTSRSDVRPLKAPCTFFIPTGTHCQYQATAPSEFLWLHINPSAFSKDMGATFACTKHYRPEALVDYCRHFSSTARSPGADREIALSYLAGLIEIAVRQTIVALGITPLDGKARRRLNDILRSVEKNPQAPCSVEEIARLAGISKSQLYRETERHFGKSPRALVEEIRIRQAQELLINSDNKLEKIAGLTGYSSGFALSRAFKRLTGSSPDAFRKRAS